MLNYLLTAFILSTLVKKSRPKIAYFNSYYILYANIASKSGGGSLPWIMTISQKLIYFKQMLAELSGLILCHGL